jgi:hypothetical protein
MTTAPKHIIDAATAAIAASQALQDRSQGRVRDAKLVGYIAPVFHSPPGKKAARRAREKSRRRNRKGKK